MWCFNLHLPLLRAGAVGETQRSEGRMHICTFESHKYSGREKMRWLRDQCFSHIFMIPWQGIPSDIRLGKDLCFFWGESDVPQMRRVRGDSVQQLWQHCRLEAITVRR